MLVAVEKTEPATRPRRCGLTVFAPVMRQRTLFLLIFAAITILYLVFKRYELQILDSGKFLYQHKTASGSPQIAQHSDQSGSGNRFKLSVEKNVTEEQEIKGVLARLDEKMPRLKFTDISTTTSAKKSQITLLNPNARYCVGDHLMVQLDLYNYLGKRKEYGGDFLRARIHSPKLNAGASGHIKDYRNGTYLVDFTLFWEGTVQVSLLLIHPSEGVSALWAARKKGFDKIAFTGHFLSGKSTVSTPCGFRISPRKDLCEYRDEHEVFYCVKPKNVPCDAFVHLWSLNHPVSYLSALEKRLFHRSNIGVEIPNKLRNISVLSCEGSQKNRKRSIQEKCRIGLGLPPTPSGYVLQNAWHPQSCSASPFNTEHQIHACLKNKLIYLLGDSTLRLWIYYLAKKVPTLKFFDFHDPGAFRTRVAMDHERNIFIQWNRHSRPFVTYKLYSVKTSRHVAKAIDQVAGDGETAVVIGMGHHFRPFPIEVFVRRMVYVRKAVKGLLLRSPGTKVIINFENVREMQADTERFGNFHGYAQYLAVKDIFQDMSVAFLDSWDMSMAFNINEIHPRELVVENQVVMFLTYIC